MIITGAQELLRTLKRLEKQAGRSMAIATHPARVEFAKRLRAKYRSEGLRVFHEPVKVSVSKVKGAVRIIGGQFFEKGTGSFFTGPKAPRSRATGKPYVVKTRSKKTLLGEEGALDSGAGRVYYGRAVFGKKATIRGMKPHPVVADVITGLAPDIPEIVGSQLLSQFQGLAGLGR